MTPRTPNIAKNSLVIVASTMAFSWLGKDQECRRHPTFSSLLKNINKLDGLINRLQDLASSAPTDRVCVAGNVQEATERRLCQ